MKRLGAIYFGEGDYGSAARILSDATGRFGSDARSLYLLALSELKLGNAAEARAAYERLRAVNPSFEGLGELEATVGTGR